MSTIILAGVGFETHATDQALRLGFRPQARASTGCHHRRGETPDPPVGPLLSFVKLLTPRGVGAGVVRLYYVSRYYDRKVWRRSQTGYIGPRRAFPKIDTIGRRPSCHVNVGAIGGPNVLYEL